MAKMTVEFEWDEEMGERWFNMGNLKLCLYGQAWTKPEYLSVKHVKTIDDNGNELYDADDQEE